MVRLTGQGVANPVGARRKHGSIRCGKRRVGANCRCQYASVLGIKTWNAKGRRPVLLDDCIIVAPGELESKSNVVEGIQKKKTADARKKNGEGGSRGGWGRKGSPRDPWGSGEAAGGQTEGGGGGSFHITSS